MFSLTIFSFYLDKLTNSAHILSLADITEPDAQKSWKLFLKIFNAVKKSQENELEKIEIFTSNELSTFLGGFQIPSEITSFKTDKDLTEYDKNLTALDARCGLIPFTPSHKTATIDIVNKWKTPNIKPYLISVYTNLAISDRANEKVINGKLYRLLYQIPLKSFDKTSPSSIQYFPNRILYKNLNQNSKMDTIEILLLNSETGELINLNDNFIVNLDFKRLLR